MEREYLYACQSVILVVHHYQQAQTHRRNRLLKGSSWVLFDIVRASSLIVFVVALFLVVAIRLLLFGLRCVGLVKRPLLLVHFVPKALGRWNWMIWLCFGEVHNELRAKTSSSPVFPCPYKLYRPFAVCIVTPAEAGREKTLATFPKDSRAILDVPWSASRIQFEEVKF